jgi:hypothetical protein
MVCQEAWRHAVPQYAVHWNLQDLTTDGPSATWGIKQPMTGEFCIPTLEASCHEQDDAVTARLGEAAAHNAEGA